VTAKKLAVFLESVELEEGILIQRLSDLEARSLHVQPELRTKVESVSRPGSQPSPTERPAPVDPPAALVTYGEL